MPSRILREGIVTSVHVNSLTWPAEIFYRRLFSIADDYGRYYAHPTLLRAALYPLQLEKVSDSDIGKWLLETEKAGLVRVYSVQEQQYLEIYKFNQQIRSKCSKYPCLANASQGDKQMSPYANANAHSIPLPLSDGLPMDNGTGETPEPPRFDNPKNGRKRPEIVNALRSCGISVKGRHAPRVIPPQDVHKLIKANWVQAIEDIPVMGAMGYGSSFISFSGADGKEVRVEASHLEPHKIELRETA